MSSETLYYNILSRPSRFAYLVAKAGNVKVDVKVVDLLKGEHKAPEYLKINPFHQIPALTDGDFNTYESAAIAKYFIVKYKLDLLPFDDLKRFALIDRAYENIREKITAATDKHIFTKRFAPVFGITKTEEEIKEASDKVIEHLENVEKFYFQDSEAHVVGDKLSLADLMLSCTLMQLRLDDDLDMAKYPKTQKFYESMQKLAFFQDVEKDFNDFLKAFLKKE